MSRTKIALLATLMLTSAAIHAAPGDQPHSLTEKQAKALATALDGKVPGKPLSCVPIAMGTTGPTAITDSVLLYRANRRVTYRNDLNGSCSGISGGGRTMVMRPTNNQYCRNDIIRVVDLTSGMQGPSCALGDFVPYTTPGK